MPSDIDVVLDSFDDPQRSALQKTRVTIGQLLPGAVESIAWGMPTWRVDGEAVVSILGFAKHNSVFPQSGSIVERLGSALDGYVVTKGTIHFDIAKPFPKPLMKALLAARIAELNERYPRASGESKEFYDNGYLKSKGRIRQGEFTGNWQWFRRDGSLMRSGTFKAGRQVGLWTTHDRSGKIVKTTDFGR